MRNGSIGLAALLLLGACVMSEYDEEGRLRNISPAALAALPAGIAPAVLIRDADGCYGIVLVQSETAEGVRLLNDQGVQVCDA